MGSYFMNFIVYTAAMIGIIFLTVFVYKKCSYGTISRSKFLNVEDCISLAPRKSLYVVRAGNERFLLASDVGRTSFIAKLEENVSANMAVNSLKDDSIDELPTIVDFHKPMKKEPKKVFKNIINNI